mgnify:CR=1 FL=1
MIDITINFIGGGIIGVVLAWILNQWTRLFINNLPSEDYKVSPISTSENNLKKISIFGLYIGMTIFTSILNVWRQWSPEFLNDLILVGALVGLARIDIKTMFIDGRIIALAVILRLIWLLFFAPQEIINSFTGLLFGAGMLYLTGFLYQTFRHRQGLGDGDAAVLGLIGMWVGWHELLKVILIAALSGILIGGIAILKNKQNNFNIKHFLTTKIPFSPFLCFGGLIVYFFEETGFFELLLVF